MALRAVPDHPKFAELKGLLRQPKGALMGWLEALWHFTGRYTPQGNVGKYPDDAIEGWIEWNGNPGELIAALVKSHWLDPDKEHRLLVHDWQEHADKATKNLLKRKKLPFCTPTVTTAYVQKPGNEHTVRTPSTKTGPVYPQTASAYPLPVPEPEPVPVRRKQRTLSSARSVPPEELAGTLPLVDGSEYAVTKSQIRDWHEAYPAVDVRRQLLVFKEWCKANPQRMKTRAGICRAINGWLSREQDRAGGNNRPGENNGKGDHNLRVLQEVLDEYSLGADPTGDLPRGEDGQALAAALRQTPGGGKRR